MNDVRAELLRLSAEMALARGMPSPYLEDHAFYVSTPKAERRRLIAIAEKAESQCREWAVRLRMAADAIAAGQSSHSAPGSRACQHGKFAWVERCVECEADFTTDISEARK